MRPTFSRFKLPQLVALAKLPVTDSLRLVRSAAGGIAVAALLLALMPTFDPTTQADERVPAYAGFGFTGAQLTPSRPDSPSGSKLQFDGANQKKVVQDPFFASCGHGCLYQRANENITVQIDYMERKQVFLEQRLDANHSVANKLTLLGSFCQPSERANGLEGLSTCQARYNDYFDLWLIKAKSALAQNELNASALESGNAAVNEGPTAERETQSPAPSLPYLLRPTQLAELAAVQDIHPDTPSWVEGASAKEPSQLEPRREDFYQFNCSSQENCAVALDQHGKPVRDTATYQAAQARWNQIRNRWQAQEATLSPRQRSELARKSQQNFIKRFGSTANDGSDLQKNLYLESAVDIKSQFNARDPATAARRTFDADRARHQEQSTTIGLKPSNLKPSLEIKVPPVPTGTNITNSYFESYKAGQIAYPAWLTTSPPASDLSGKPPSNVSGDNGNDWGAEP